MNQPVAQPASHHNGKEFLRDPATMRWIGTALIAAFGLTSGGYLLGNGLLRAKDADRAVTVRGLAERDVVADLATWTISYSATSTSLAEAQAKMRSDTKAIEHFFGSLGFPQDALQPTGGERIELHERRNHPIHGAPAHGLAQQ